MNGTEGERSSNDGFYSSNLGRVFLGKRRDRRGEIEIST